eukprot:scaffold5194_cov118-Cylindrotheca_fusiformis.AAC.5
MEYQSEAWRAASGSCPKEVKISSRYKTKAMLMGRAIQHAKKNPRMAIKPTSRWSPDPKDCGPSVSAALNRPDSKLKVLRLPVKLASVKPLK